MTMYPKRAVVTAVAAMLGVTLVALLTSFGLAAPASAGSAGSAAPVVVTDKGAVRGTATDTGRVFHRIPFAAPPIGDLRWRAPRPAAAWAGIRDATVPGPSCAQNEFPVLGQPRVTTEDCLYLNVYTPPGRARHQPVMVWFHGGSFMNGSANLYDGSALARRGVVVVTVNYRLGAFGFLAHPALSGEDPAKSGNYGLLDQQAALRWVQANAAAFGGDERRVTIFGESAGGISVCDHLTSPLATGLFAAAIIESGPCSLLGHALPAAEAAGERFATATGCAGQADVPGCLRSQPVATILDAQGVPEGPETPWAPNFATPVLPVDPMQAIMSGAYDRVPTIAGTNLDEGTIFVAVMEAQGIAINAETYPIVLSQMFGADAPRVQAEYPGSAYGGDYRLALSAVETDSMLACPTWALNQSLARASSAYAYEFADRTAPNLYSVTPDFPLGAFHGAELAYLFPIGDAFDPAQRRLSDRMLSYWTRFAAVGDPNSDWTPRWQRFQPAHPTVLTLDRTGVTNRSGFGVRHQCGFWRTVHA